MADPSTAATSEALPSAPAPWECKGQAWWFIAWPLGPGKKEIHPGAIHPVDYDTDTNKNYESGLAMIQVVRYTSTPVGPYDEIVYIPGYFSSPYSSRTHYRITNIYVSKPASVYNGRTNWNIPKHLAVFNFDEGSTAGSTTITVAHPETPDNPFFAAVVKDIPAISKVPLPLSTSYFPMNLEFHQPPLNGVDTDAGRANGETATEGWKAFTPWQGGKVKLIKCEMKNGNGDGRWPDKVEGLWSLGIKWEEGMTLKFPEPKELKGKL